MYLSRMSGQEDASVRDGGEWKSNSNTLIECKMAGYQEWV